MRRAMLNMLTTSILEMPSKYRRQHDVIQDIGITNPTKVFHSTNIPRAPADGPSQPQTFIMFYQSRCEACPRTQRLESQIWDTHQVLR